MQVFLRIIHLSVLFGKSFVLVLEFVAHFLRPLLPFLGVDLEEEEVAGVIGGASDQSLTKLFVALPNEMRLVKEEEEEEE